MSHMVIYRGPDGKPGYHQTDEIHDAVAFVEGLKNEQDVEHARIFRLEEVQFSYKPYFRVELGDAPAVAAAPATPAVSAPAAAAAPAPAAAAPAPAAAAPAPAAAPAAEAAASATDAASDAADKASDAAASAATDAAEKASEPTVTAPSSDSGLGARRGLFGR